MMNCSRSAGLAYVAAAAVLAAAARSSLQSATSSARGARIVATYTLPDLPLAKVQNAVLPNSIANDHKFLLGGVGSDLWHEPGDPANEFWMTTDRGPNGKIDKKSVRTFPVPEFTPLVLHVRCDKGSIEILKTIAIVGASGKGVTGLSNVEGHDEQPYDATGSTKLAFNPSGLDVEGMVRTTSGEFWLSEEYAPSIAHVGSTGKVIERFVPLGSPASGADYPITASLPAILAKRKDNRGFESLALAPDEKTLFAALQSPLSNPDKKTGEWSRNARVLAFDVAAKKATAEWIYRFESAGDVDPKAKGKQEEMRISALVAVDATHWLVLERTDDSARIYVVDSSAATNVLGTRWDDSATSPSLEAVTDPATEKITVLPKQLIVDLATLEGVPGKIEGVAMIDRSTIAIANDNDFDIVEPDERGDNAGKGKKSRLLVISLAEALP
jgi:hypothetical protein